MIFLIVAVLVGYGVIRYRARAGAPDPRPTFGSRKLEVTWTVIPVLLLLAVFVFTVRTMALVDAPRHPDRPADLVITGHQWFWEARYPNGALVTHEIHIPVGQRLLAQILSADVIHDFWVPQLARKIDAVPAHAAYIWLSPDSAGTYQGACSEFCGLQHAWMHFLVIAEPESQFNAWIQHQAEPPVAPTGGLAAQGLLLYQKKCQECHARNHLPLDHIASRRLLEGDLPNTDGNRVRWIREPQSIKPGNKMPDQHLSTEDLLAVSAYLGILQ